MARKLKILRKRAASVLLRTDSIRYQFLFVGSFCRRLMGDRWGASRRWSEGLEDEVILEKASSYLEDGFYVDVGANLPMKRSNSYRLYCSGMKGICIEPNLELAGLYERIRPRDEVLNVAVGPEAGIVALQRFNFHVYSTCHAAEAEERLTGRNPANLARVLRTSMVAMLPLRKVLEHSQLGSRNRFFLLKVDTEGFDLRVLQSNDWSRFRPLLVLTEASGEQEGVATFLEQQGYVLCRKFGANQLFERVSE